MYDVSFYNEKRSCIKNYRFQLSSLIDFKQPSVEAQKSCQEYHVLNKISVAKNRFICGSLDLLVSINKRQYQLIKKMLQTYQVWLVLWQAYANKT